MPGGDAQQGDCGTLRMTPALLPVAESVNADSHGVSELHLGEPDKAPQGCDVLAGFKLSEHEAFSNARGNGLGELFLNQLWNLTHRRSSSSLLEGETMLAPILEVLDFIPFHPHAGSIDQRLGCVNGLALDSGRDPGNPRLLPPLARGERWRRARE